MQHFLPHAWEQDNDRTCDGNEVASAHMGWHLLSVNKMSASSIMLRFEHRVLHCTTFNSHNTYVPDRADMEAST